MPPDQGLRYELAAVLGRRAALQRIARAHPRARVVDLDVADLALVPVVPQLAVVTPAALCALGLEDLPGGTPSAATQRAELLTGPESGFEILTPGLAALIEAGSTVAPLAYVEADYVGREGRQASAVWQSGRLVVGPLLLGPREPFETSTAPISVALRAVGLRTRARRDVFLIAGLGRHRRTAEWVGSEGTGENRTEENG